MNLDGFQPIHQSNLQPGVTYYLRTRFGSGYVLAKEDLGIKGWSVELQLGAEFSPPPSQKKMRNGCQMTVPVGEGQFYEPKV